jgi:hypothetical protein
MHRFPFNKLFMRLLTNNSRKIKEEKEISSSKFERKKTLYIILITEVRFRSFLSVWILKLTQEKLTILVRVLNYSKKKTEIVSSDFE